MVLEMLEGFDATFAQHFFATPDACAIAGTHRALYDQATGDLGAAPYHEGLAYLGFATDILMDDCDSMAAWSRRLK